jgi:pimeloyl-ACP methyl ester carboxylesterase
MICKAQSRQAMNLMWILFILVMSVEIASAQSPAYTQQDCTFPVPAGATVDCGTVSAPENRADDNPNNVTLPVVVFQSNAADPADPLIFLQGGPGGATLDLIPALYEPFIAPLLADRDVIFFDQRGTGQALPSLACPEVQEASVDDFEAALSPAASATLYVEAFAACADRLQADGVDVSAYTSAESAADVVAIIEALGYEQAHLYGASYGTRLAQTVVRDYPEVVASIIADSAIPVEVNLYEQQAAKAEFALDRIFTACAEDSACASAYPDLGALFYETITRLDADPVTLPLTNPVTGQSYDGVITGADYVGAIFIGLQVPQLIPTIPQIMYDAANADYSGLVTPLTLSLILTDSVSLGMFTSVNCYEEVYASSVEGMADIWNETPALAGFAAYASYGDPATIFAVCDAWGARTFDAIEADPVQSDIPLLGFAGEFDPATPVTWTEQVADNFVNSVMYEFPAQTHTLGLTNPCAVTILQDFLNDPMQEPDSACLGAMPAIRFVVPEDVSATPATAGIPLMTYEDTDAGWSTLVPEGWTVAGDGVFARGESMLDPTTLIVGQGSDTYDVLLDGILASVGVGQAPEISETLTADTGAWHLYTTDGMGSTISIAIQDEPETPYLVQE